MSVSQSPVPESLPASNKNQSTEMDEDDDPRAHTGLRALVLRQDQQAKKSGKSLRKTTIYTRKSIPETIAHFLRLLLYFRAFSVNSSEVYSNTDSLNHKGTC